MDFKVCTKCNVKLEASEENFHKQKKGKYGFKSVCKPCAKKDRDRYQSTEKYKKRHRERMAEWRKKNHQRALEISRESYRRHGAKRNAIKRERYRKDPEYKAKQIERERKYKESGRRQEMNAKPEQREKARLRNKKRRSDPLLRAKDYAYSARYRKKHKDRLHKMHVSNRKELVPSYVAQSLRMSVNELTPEIYEVKKTIIKLKRELKNNNVKIR